MNNLLREYSLGNMCLSDFILKVHKLNVDHQTICKTLAAFMILHKTNVFMDFLVELMNGSSAAKELETVIEGLIQSSFNLENLHIWPRLRQKIKYRMLNGLALDSTEVEFWQHTKEEKYFSSLNLDKLVLYKDDLLPLSPLYRKIMSRKHIISNQHWDIFKSFPFNNDLSLEEEDEKKVIVQINRLYFQIKNAEQIYSISELIKDPKDLLRFNQIMELKSSNSPTELKRHFEWFIFKSNTLLELSSKRIKIEHLNFILDRIEDELISEKCIEAPQMLQILFEMFPDHKCIFYPFLPIVTDLLKKRPITDDFFLIPLIKIIKLYPAEKQTEAEVISLLLNYLSMESIKVRYLAAQIIVEKLEPMEKYDRLPFVAKMWDLICQRKDSTLQFLKQLEKMEGDFLQNRIKQLKMKSPGNI